MNAIEIMTQLNSSVDRFIQDHKRQPRLIVISDAVLNTLQSAHEDDNFLTFRGIKIITTIRQNVFGVF